MDIRPNFLFAMVASAAVWGVLALTTTVTSAQETKTQQDGVYTDAQVKAGEAIYMVQCVECHIRDLTGGNPEMHPAPALTGKDFTGYWNGKSLDEMYTIIITNMPQTDPGHLKPEEVASLIAFIASHNSGKPGTTPLPADPAALKNIKFKF